MNAAVLRKSPLPLQQQTSTLLFCSLVVRRGRKRCNRQTDVTSTVTLAEHARRGLMKSTTVQKPQLIATVHDINNADIGSTLWCSFIMLPGEFLHLHGPVAVFDTRLDVLLILQNRASPCTERVIAFQTKAFLSRSSLSFTPSMSAEDLLRRVTIATILLNPSITLPIRKT